MFIITGTYVGYHASQQTEDISEGHDIVIELYMLETDTGIAQILQNIEPKKSII